MSNQTIQIFPQAQAARQETPRVAPERPAGEAFSRHLEKKLDAERPKNILKGSEKPRPVKDTDNSDTEKTAQKTDDPAGSVTALLAQLMADLQKLAQEQGMQAGAYRLTKADEGLITQMAESAGLDKASLAQLLDKLRAGQLTLPELFSTFSRHFQELTPQQSATVPDTELPLLASMLQRMGASESALDTIAAQAVTSDDKLNLAQFLKAMEHVSAPATITLSNADREQLEALLAKAGATKQFVAGLFPGKDLQPVTLDIQQLKDTLAQGIANIEQNRPSTELPAFMTDLKTLLAQTGFSEQGTSWSPVLQKAMAEIQEKLANLVDMATVQAQKAKDLQAENLAQDQSLLAGKDGIAAAADTPAVAAVSAENQDNALNGQAKDETQQDARPDSMPQPALTVSANTTPDLRAARPAAAPHPLSHTAKELVFQQLNDGIQQGLKNREHHLVLRLYPPELGEVKVDLLVRDDRVTIHFAMENQRVKDVIENSMQDFKDSLEQRGFMLSGCNVSVDQQGQSDDLWQRWLESGGAQPAPSYQTVRALPEETLYHRLPAVSGADSVNLFV